MIRQHIYHNPDGTVFGRKTKHQDGKFSWEKWDGNAFVFGATNAPIYRADKVLGSHTVIIVEGEKDADTLDELGLCATTGAHGAGKWDDSWTPSFAGKAVLICGDRDEQGEGYVIRAGRAISQVASSIHVLTLPEEADSKKIKDVTDLFEANFLKFTDRWEEMLKAKKPFADFWEAGKNGEKPKKQRIELPEIVSAADLCDNNMLEPPHIITGILHQGSKLSLGGGSKAFKTWTLLQMACAVTTGEQWLEFATCGKPVIYLNLELDTWAIRKRISDICEAMRIHVPKDLRIWNLRGYICAAHKLFDKLSNAIDEYGYVLGVLDPIYKLLGDGDENSARDIGKLLNELENFAMDNDIAMAYGAHFSKGNQAAKEAIDRMSGSGVFARDPDSILTMTAHVEDQCFTLDMTLRNLPPQLPFVVRREHPLMVPHRNADPEKIKRPNQPGQAYCYRDILNEMSAITEMRTGEIEAKVKEETGMSHGQFFNLWKEMKEKNLVTQAGKGWVKA